MFSILSRLCLWPLTATDQPAGTRPPIAVFDLRSVRPIRIALRGDADECNVSAATSLKIPGPCACALSQQYGRQSQRGSLPHALQVVADSRLQTIERRRAPLVQRACRVVRLSWTAYYRPPPPRMRTDAPVIAALMTVVAVHGRWASGGVSIGYGWTGGRGITNGCIGVLRAATDFTAADHAALPDAAPTIAPGAALPDEQHR